MGEIHKHITIKDLKRVEILDIDKADVDELAHCCEVGDKISGCSECQRRFAIVQKTREYFGSEIWGSLSCK